jgi:hypothetical protein
MSRSISPARLPFRAHMTRVLVHGTSANVEFIPISLDPTTPTVRNAAPRGFGTVIEGAGVTAWVHFSIPLPRTAEVFLADLQPKADARTFVEYALIYFMTGDEETGGGGTQVKAVHIYDGAREIAAYTQLALEGDLSEVRNELSENRNAFKVNALIRSALGISVFVTFGTRLDDAGPPTTITFTAAGADSYLY